MSKKKKHESGIGRAGKTILMVSAFVALLMLSYGVILYNRYFKPNTVLLQEKTYLFISTGSGYADVVSALQAGGFIKDVKSFESAARQMNYPERVKPGRYKLKPDMGNRELIALLRSGAQEPVRLVIRNHRTIQELAGAVSRKIEADSASIVFLLKDRFLLANEGLKPEEALGVFIPNTYEFYWNTSAEEFFRRMVKESKKFWTENRKQKAEKQGLTAIQAVIIASIVDKETNKNDEKPRIAGVYLNRFRKGWKLEADPTLVFAVGDFSIRRVLDIHKEVDSPYNTYLYTGLPPGPICIPSISSIDAVLNAEQHDFMFFCARADFSGYHAFARTYQQHLVNARLFQKEMNRRGIRS
jgi:UPF0755 protein